MVLRDWRSERKDRPRFDAHQLFETNRSLACSLQVEQAETQRAGRLMEVQPKGIVLKAVRTHCTDAEWLGRSRCTRCDIFTTVVPNITDPDRTDVLLRPIENILFANHGLIYREGDPLQAVFMLRRGFVKLVQHTAAGTSRIVRIIKPGAWFGLESMIDERSRHTAFAVGDVDVCRIPGKSLRRLQQDHFPIFEHLMARWQQNLDSADQVITHLSTGSSRARVASFLLQARFDVGQGECEYLSREELAGLLGLTIETVSRTLAELKRSGILKEEHRSFSFDREQLERIAQD